MYLRPRGREPDTGYLAAMVTADRRIGNAAGTLPLHHAVRSTTDTRNGDAPLSARHRRKPSLRQRLLPPARRRAISRRMTWAVVALQAALLLTLAVTPTDPPGGPRLLELIWAWMHKPAFYPLAALLVGGPTLTWIAWRTPGRHRTALAWAWTVFLIVLIGAFGERTAVMMRVLWWRVNR